MGNFTVHHVPIHCAIFSARQRQMNSGNNGVYLLLIIFLRSGLAWRVFKIQTNCGGIVLSAHVGLLEGWLLNKTHVAATCRRDTRHSILDYRGTFPSLKPTHNSARPSSSNVVRSLIHPPILTPPLMACASRGSQNHRSQSFQHWKL